MTDPTDSETPTIGIALSGGGVRASLFSLGVLLYLADTGLNRRVTLISSVSGGSITNAAVGLAGDFSRVEPPEFHHFAGRLAHTLAKQGSFFLPSMRRLVAYVATSFAVVVILFRAARWLFPKQVNEGASSLGQITTYYLIFLAAALLFSLSSRDELQRRKFRKLLFGVVHGDQPITKQLRRRRMPHMDQIPDSQVTHVLCATELNSGRPMFFSQKWTHSPAYGWGRSNVSLVDAVYASAAFPAIFPPLRLRAASLRLSGGHLPGPKPHTYVLSDGGAYNNLANQWHRFSTRMKGNMWELDHRFMMPEPPQFTVVVNASAPPRAVYLSRNFVVRNFLAFTRVIVVMYENTVRPRLNILRGPAESKTTAVIDLAESPLDAVEHLAASSEDQGVRQRAAESVEILGTAQQEYWIDLRGTTSTLQTTLAPVGFVSAAGLLRHGYISAAAVLNARLRAPGPAAAKPVHWFEDLARTGNNPGTPNAFPAAERVRSTSSRMPPRW